MMYSTIEHVAPAYWMDNNHGGHWGYQGSIFIKKCRHNTGPNPPLVAGQHHLPRAYILISAP